MGVLTTLYQHVYNYLGGNETLISTIGSFTVLTGFFWGLNLLLLYTDITGKPSWMMKYKVQPDRNAPVEIPKLVKALKTVLFNTFVINPGVAYVMWVLQDWRGCSFSPLDIPSWGWILKDLVCIAIIEEFAFYYSHRVLHLPFFYKHIHKKHHEWTAPIGITAMYNHPLEHLTSNALTVLSGPLIMKSHIVVFFIWYALAATQTTLTHSGYHLPFMTSPEFHDYHHAKFNQNYGTFGLLDWVHGTSDMFRGDIPWKRHRIWFSLLPPRVRIPDGDKVDRRDEKKQG